MMIIESTKQSSLTSQSRFEYLTHNMQMGDPLSHVVVKSTNKSNTDRELPSVFTFMLVYILQDRLSLLTVKWLYDALNLAYRGWRANQAQTVTKDAVVNAIVDLYDQIKSDIDTLREKLNRGSEDDSGIEMDIDEHEILRDCLDMISVMTENLPDEFANKHNIATIPDEVDELRDLIEPEDMERTLFGLVKHDETLRWRLQRILTKDYCTKQLLLKLEKRASIVFERLATHVREGPQSDPQIIARCAQHLRTIVAQCKHYINTGAPLSKKTRSEATKVLVKILGRVCQRDEDIYDEIDWRRTQPDPTQPYNRNLFVNLLERPPPPDVAGNVYTRGESFFFTTFEIFSAAEMIHCRSPLENIIGILKENGAPGELIDKLEKIIEDIDEECERQASSPPRSPSPEETGLQHSLPSSPATAEPSSQRRRLG